MNKDARVTGAQYLQQNGLKSTLLTAEILTFEYNNSEASKDPRKRVEMAAFVAEIYEALAAATRLDETSLRNELELWAGIRRGYRVREDSCVSWWVFDMAESDDAILSALESRGVQIHGYQCHRGDFGSCGRWYAREVLVDRRGSRVLVTQSASRDF